jgi:hypothetical protein
MLVRLVVGAFSDSNATAITLSSFLKDDRWPDFPRAAQCADATSLTLILISGELEDCCRAAQPALMPAAWALLRDFITEP